MYGARNPPEEPPCENCRVNVLSDNQEALNVYLTTRSQYIMGFNGPVAINQMAVWELIDRLEVKDPVNVFHRVIRCGQVILSKQMEKKK
jgi:hypothetical protein